jgi:hypothetical protein
MMFVRKSILNEKVWVEVAQTFEENPSRYFSFGFFGLTAHFDRSPQYVLWSNRQADLIAWQADHEEALV